MDDKLKQELIMMLGNQQIKLGQLAEQLQLQKEILYADDGHQTVATRNWEIDANERIHRLEDNLERYLNTLHDQLKNQTELANRVAILEQELLSSVKQAIVMRSNTDTRLQEVANRIADYEAGTFFTRIKYLFTGNL